MFKDGFVSYALQQDEMEVVREKGDLSTPTSSYFQNYFSKIIQDKNKYIRIFFKRRTRKRKIVKKKISSVVKSKFLEQLGMYSIRNQDFGRLNSSFLLALLYICSSKTMIIQIIDVMLTLVDGGLIKDLLVIASSHRLQHII